MVPRRSGELAAAANGAPVLIPAGRYRERLEVLRTTELRSADGPGTVTVELDGDLLVLADCTLRGLVLTGSGVVVGEDARLEFDDCRILDTPSTGLTVLEHARVRAHRLTIERTGGNGVYAGDHGSVELREVTVRRTGFTGVHLAGRVEAGLTGCTVEDSSEHGCRITDDATARIHGSRVARTAMSGIVADTAGRLTLTDCEIAGSGRAGVIIAAPTRVRAERCRITDTAGSAFVAWTGTAPEVHGLVVETAGMNGLLVMDGGGGVFDDCDIGGTRYPGLYVGAGARPRLRRLHVHDVAGDVEDIVVHETARALVERVLRPPDDAPAPASALTPAPTLGAAPVTTPVPALTLGPAPVPDAAPGVGPDRVRAPGPVLEQPSPVGSSAPASPSRRHPAVTPEPGPVAPPGASLMPAVSTSVPPADGVSGGPEGEPAAEPAESADPADQVAGLLAKLEAWPGLLPAKRAIEDVVSWTTRERRRVEAGLPPRAPQRDLVIAGDRAADHVVVARLYGRVLRALGELPSGHVAEVPLAYLAQHTESARAACDRAVGGVLLVECDGSEDENRARAAAEFLAGTLADHDEAGAAAVTVLAGPADTVRRIVVADPRLTGRFRRIVPGATVPADVPAESDTVHGEP